MTILAILALSNSELYSQVLKYRIVKKEDISFMNTPRMVYRIILDVNSIPSEQEMKNTAVQIWGNGNKSWQEFTVFMYLPDMDIESSAFGVGEFRPSGLLRFDRNENASIGTKWETKKTITQPKQPLNGKLKEYNIGISAVNAGESKVKINIISNLPDGTNLSLSVYRIYFVKGDATSYSGELGEKAFTLKSGQYETIMPIYDTEWYTRYQKLTTSIPSDFPQISKISEKISINVMYTAARPQPSNVIAILGKRGEFVTGEGSRQFGTGTAGKLTSLSATKEINYPFKK